MARGSATLSRTNFTLNTDNLLSIDYSASNILIPSMMPDDGMTSVQDLDITLEVYLTKSGSTVQTILSERKTVSVYENRYPNTGSYYFSTSASTTFRPSSTLTPGAYQIVVGYKNGRSGIVINKATVNVNINEAYNITYNGGIASTSGGSKTVVYTQTSNSHTMKTFTSIFTRPKGYRFKGWSYSGSTYAEGASVNLPNLNVTFTAILEKVTYGIEIFDNSANQILYMGNYTISDTAQSFQTPELELRYKGLEKYSAASFNTNTTNGTSLTTTELNQVANSVTLSGGKISYRIPANVANNIRIEISTRKATFYIDVHDDIFLSLFADSISYQQDTGSDQSFTFSEAGLRSYISAYSGYSMDYRKFTGGSSPYLPDITITHNPPNYIVTVKAGAAVHADVVIDHSITKLTLSITPNGGSGSQSLVFGEDAMLIENSYLPYSYKISRITPISRTGYVQTGLMLNDSLKAIGTTVDLRTIYTDVKTNDVTANAPVGWEAIKLNVNLTKYKNDGTTENSTTTISYGENYTSPLTSASVNGYAFKGFYVDTNGSLLDKGESISAADLINSAYPEPIPLEAGYTVRTINVTEQLDLITYKLKMLNDVGSTHSTESTFNITTTSLALKPKTKTGYTFNGYKVVGSVSNGTVAINNTDNTITLNKVYQDVTVEPIFEIITYKISYQEGGSEKYPVSGSLLSTRPTSYNVNTETIVGSTLIGTLTRAGYQNPTFSPLQIAKGSIDNKTFTVNWTPINYTITINLDGGSRTSGESSIGYNVNNLETSNITVALGANPTRSGYTFAGWSVVATTVNSVTPTVSGSTLTIPSKFYGNFTVKALWTLITYNIGYELGGTTNYPLTNDITPKPATYNVETPTISYSIANLSRGGFTSPSLKINGASVSKIDKGSTGARAVTIDWTPSTYTISLNANSGTGASISKTSYKPSDILTASTTVAVTKGSRTGYVLDNITIVNYAGPAAKKPTVSGNTVTIPSGAWGNFSIQLNWKPISYSIQFKNGEEITKTSTHNYDSQLGVLDVVSKTGYTFDGWYVSGNKISNTTTNLTSTANAVLTAEARFTPITYNVAFQTNGVGTQGTRVVTYDAAIGTLPTLSLHGYDFDGWYDKNTNSNGSGNQVTSASKNLMSTAGSTITLYAKWTAKSYTVTYNKTKYGTPTVVNYKTGNNDSPALATDPLIVSIAATSQAGWSVSRSLAAGTNSNITLNNSNNTVSIRRSAAANVLAVNTWTGNTYSITYPETKNTTASRTYQVSDAPQEITLPKPTESGWSDTGLKMGTNTTSASTVAGYKLTIPKDGYGNVVLNTTWTGNTYNITVLNGYGGTIETISYTVSTSAQDKDLPSNVVRNGYSRSGWTKTKSDITISSNRINIPANVYGDFTVTMSWALEDYNFQMNYNGGSPANPITRLNYNLTSNPLTYNLGSPTLNEKVLKGYTLTKTAGQSGNTNIDSIFTGKITDGVVSNTVTSFIIPKGTYGSFKLDAIWGIFYYRVTLKSNGAGQVDLVLPTVTNDQPGYISASGFTKDRYKLFGWAYTTTGKPKYSPNHSGIITDANGNKSTEENSASPMQVTLYAYWVSDAYAKYSNRTITSVKVGNKASKLMFNNKIVFDKPYSKVD